MNDEQIATLREHLQDSDNNSLREYCGELFAAGDPDGKQTISELHGTLYYHDLETGKLTTSFEAIQPNEDDHTIFVGANQSRDRSTLVTAGWHGAVRVWNAVTRELITSFELTLEN